MKQFILYIPDEIFSNSLENFIANELNMNLLSVGCNSIQYISKRMPKNFRNRVIENFGAETLKSLKFKTLNDFDENIDYEEEMLK